MQTNHIIKTTALTKYYGKDIGIKDLNLQVNRGEIFGFLGPNGAGKTTTIRTLLDMIRPTSGRATIFGYDTQLSTQKIHNQIAYLPGEMGFPKNWTGQRILNYMFKFYDHKINWSSVKELARHLSLDLNKKVQELSKGNKQKIGIILTLVPNVELLILDEPTSGLDPLIKNEFYKLLAEKQQETNCTVFLSSHQLEEVEKVAHRVGIINRGSLVEVSTLSELKNLAFKHVELTLASAADTKLPPKLAKTVKNLVVEDSTLTFLCTRNKLDDVLDWLHHVSYSDVNIRNSTLEDIFLEYYQVSPYENHYNNKTVEAA
ncbi:MAG: ABC transporter ATP-binding protein [Candidatus Bathyarchaeota archaeon]|nr:ABC transporter ATP-binding protein [Candidatus Bathyarchaeota archaeon]